VKGIGRQTGRPSILQKSLFKRFKHYFSWFKATYPQARVPVKRNIIDREGLLTF